MFKNIAPEGRRNLCGSAVKRLRIHAKLSQRELADQLQLFGLDFGKNTIQQIESGERFVTDIELRVLAKYFDETTDTLIGG